MPSAPFSGRCAATAEPIASRESSSRPVRAAMVKPNSFRVSRSFWVSTV